MIDKSTLDKDTRQYLESLLIKNPKDLKLDEIAFLKSRADYLTDSELKHIPEMEEAEIVEMNKVAKEELKKEPRIEKPKKAKRKFLN